MLSFVYLSLSIIPRRYVCEALPSEWLTRQKTYEDEIRQSSHSHTDEQIQRILSDDLLQQLQQHMCDAITRNRSVNKRRLAWFNRALRLSALAIVPIFVEVLFAIIVWLRHLP